MRADEWDVHNLRLIYKTYLNLIRIINNNANYLVFSQSEKTGSLGLPEKIELL